MNNLGMLFSILLSDVLNPVLFTFMIYAVGSKPILARINGYMEKASDVIMPVLLLAIGLALLLDSVWYFTCGESFF